jgi:hypothetical protein
MRNPFWQQVSRRESPYPITGAGTTQPAVGLNSSNHLRPSLTVVWSNSRLESQTPPLI